MTGQLVEFANRDLAPVAPRDTDSWTEVVAEVGRLAAMICETEFVPKGLRGSAPSAAAAMLYGREVGLPPMTALTQIFVQDGRPAMYAEAMRALVLAAGHEFVFRESTSATATAIGRRRGTTEWSLPVTWTIDDARKAGLIRPRSAWETFPRAMLKARVTTELCRDLFPDVIHGFRSVEELTDEPAADTQPEPATRQRVTVQRQSAQDTPQSPTAPSGTPGITGASPRDGGATKKRTRKPPAGETTPRSQAPAGPPLPGEPGYGDLAQPPSAPESPTPPGQVDASASPDDDGQRGEEPLTTSDGDAEAQPPDVPAGGTSEVHTPAGAPTDDTPEVVGDAEAPARRVDLVRLRLDFERLGVTNRDHRIAYLGILLGRNIATSTELSRRECHQLIETLALCKTRDDLDSVAGATEAHRDKAEQATLLDPP